MAPSALPRQPASPVSGDFPYDLARKPAVGGLVAIGVKSLGDEFDKSSAHCAEVLRASLALWPFSGETIQRPGLIVLSDRDGSRGG